MSRIKMMTMISVEVVERSTRKMMMKKRQNIMMMRKEVKREIRVKT
jgi:hypothetical protein